MEDVGEYAEEALLGVKGVVVEAGVQNALTALGVCEMRARFIAVSIV